MILVEILIWVTFVGVQIVGLFQRLFAQEDESVNLYYGRREPRVYGQEVRKDDKPLILPIEA